MNNDTGGELPKVCAFRDRVAPDQGGMAHRVRMGRVGSPGDRQQVPVLLAGRQAGWELDRPGPAPLGCQGGLDHPGVRPDDGDGCRYVNYYSTECEGNYFGAGKYDSGAGFEMVPLERLYRRYPGRQGGGHQGHECTYPRGGFATTGLFGQLLGNGAYPITRAYWWIATFRNRLKGYVYTGMRHGRYG